MRGFGAADLVCAGCVVVGGVVLFATSRENVSYTSGKFIGQLILAALPALLVFFLLKRRAPQAWKCAFGVAVLAMGLMNGVGSVMLARRAGEAGAMDDLRRSSEKLVDAGRAGTASVGDVERAGAALARAAAEVKGDAGRIMQVESEVSRAVLERSKAVLNARTAFMDAGALGTRSMDSPAGRAARMKLLKAWEVELASAAAVVADQARSVEEAVRAAGGSGPAWDRYQTLKRTQQPLMNELYALEKQALAEVKGALEVLERSVGKWQIEAGMFVFEKESDRLAYQGHIDRMVSIDAQQQELKDRLARVK